MFLRNNSVSDSNFGGFESLIFVKTCGIYLVTICIFFLECLVQSTNYILYICWLPSHFFFRWYSSLLPDTPLHHIYGRNVLGVISAICWTSTKVWAMVNEDLRPPVVEILEKAFIQVGREICRSKSTWTTRMSMMSKNCRSRCKKISQHDMKLLNLEFVLA